MPNGSSLQFVAATRHSSRMNLTHIKPSRQISETLQEHFRAQEWLHNNDWWHFWENRF